MLGGVGYYFAGDFETKGCYAYSSGTYVSHAYYGTDGTMDQMISPLSGDKYRPKGHDCKGSV